MKKEVINSILILTGILFSISSCTEPIDIKLDSSFSRLTVYGEISTDTSIQKIRLSRSSDYFYNLPSEGVSGASVKISDDSTEVDLNEDPEMPGTYETPSPYYGIPGKTYSLFIQNVDINGDGVKESYFASSYLPYLLTPDSIQLNYFHRGTLILLYSKDPASTNDFYAFKVRKNGILLTDSLQEITTRDDVFFNGNYIDGIPVKHLRDDSPGEKVNPGDTIVLEVYGITKEYFDFINDAQTELFGSNPLFSGPPANIPSNLNNGALGFFAAVNIKRATAIATAKQ